jgi:methionyl-tRNA formyltransferase
VRLVFAGTPQVAVPALDALLASQHQVVAVLTRPDTRAGRGRHEVRSPVAARAVEADIEVLQPAKASDPALLERLAELAPDCCPVVAYGGLVPRTLLDLPPDGWVNLHFSLLPAWRGAAPVQHAILHGDDVTGATVFRLEEGLDTGPVLSVMTEPIGPRDTSGDLLDRLATGGAGLLVATLDGLERGELTARPQPAHGVSLAPKLAVDDARVDWTTPAFHVDRLVRACTPAPGAWTTWQGERLGLEPVEPVKPLKQVEQVGPAGPSELAAGQVAVGRREVLVGAGDGQAVRLGQVRPAGRKAMAAADWARGVRDLDGGTLR